MNFFKRKKLIPFIKGVVDLKKGDTLVGITSNDSVNYIASICGLKAINKKGIKVKWKALSSNMIKSKGEIAFLDCMDWIGGNVVKVKKSFVNSEMIIEWFKEVKS